MPTTQYAGHAVDVDAEGFLANPSDWTPEIAAAIAHEQGLTLTPDHWRVLEAARTDFQGRGQSPGPRRLTACCAIEMRRLYELFPKGPGKLVAKVAGIPKPKSCL